MKFDPIIKWTGSKRKQGESIISYFPKEIDTYYEPFCGGASVLRYLMESDIKVDRYICNDICKPLIELWNIIKNNKDELIRNYISEREKFISDKDYFYEVRTRFNKDNNPYDFMFLTRTSANGLVRFNSKGEFNAPVHRGRDGIHPDKLQVILDEWSFLLNQHNVEFTNHDYQNFIINSDDLMYLDPPYANLNGQAYYGTLTYEEFFDWVRKQKGKYVLSFDGISGNKDTTYDVPEDIYTQHIYLENGISGFGKIHKKQEYGKESLYIK